MLPFGIPLLWKYFTCFFIHPSLSIWGPGVHPRQHRVEGQDGCQLSRHTIQAIWSHHFIQIFALDLRVVTHAHRTHKENTCKLHTHRAAAGFEPSTLEVQAFMHLHATKPITINIKSAHQLRFCLSIPGWIESGNWKYCGGPYTP